MDTPTEKALGWSQSGTLIAGNTNKAVKLQTEFPFMGNYTIQFEVQSLPGSVQPRCLAEVVWSVKGNAVRRLIHVTDGASITGTSQAVNVRLYDDSNASIAGQNYKASIQIAYGTRGSNKQPPFLFIDSELVGAASLGAVTLPTDVGANSIMVVATQQSAGVVAQGEINVIQNVTGGITWDPRDYDWVPLMPGTRTLTLTNFSAVSVRFAVFLGIDG